MGEGACTPTRKVRVFRLDGNQGMETRGEISRWAGQRRARCRGEGCLIVPGAYNPCSCLQQASCLHLGLGGAGV